MLSRLILVDAGNSMFVGKPLIGVVFDISCSATYESQAQIRILDRSMP